MHLTGKMMWDVSKGEDERFYKGSLNIFRDCLGNLTRTFNLLESGVVWDFSKGEDERLY